MLVVFQLCNRWVREAKCMTLGLTGSGTKEFLPDEVNGNYPVVFQLRGGIPGGAGESRIPVVFRPLTWGWHGSRVHVFWIDRGTRGIAPVKVT